MSNGLFEQIRALIRRGIDEKRDTFFVTNDILALIAEAMLSEEVVEAMVWNGNPNREWTRRNNPADFAWLTKHHRSDMAAALTAAGITPGEAREGGEGDG